MPNKTIYVSDDDLPLFTRAQELVGGNISGAVVAALRMFVDLQDAREAGYDTVVVRVGRHGVRRQRFVGRLLASDTRYSDDGVGIARHVYQGRGGRFALHTHRVDWDDYRPEDQTAATKGNWLKSLTGLTSLRSTLGIDLPDWGDYTLELVDTFDDLVALLPGRLARQVAAAVDRPDIEDIDV